MGREVTLDEAARIVRDARRTAVRHGPPTVVLAWAVWLVLPRPPAVFLVGSGLVTLSWLVTVAVWLQGSRGLRRWREAEHRRAEAGGRADGETAVCTGAGAGTRPDSSPVPFTRDVVFRETRAGASAACEQVRASAAA